MYIPTRDTIIKMVAQNMYSGRILNNAHRGDIVEMMVLSALGADWNCVSLGWNAWDLQRGSGKEIVRIQVKQIAALQLWGYTKRLFIKFGWKKSIPEYFKDYNPGEAIETEGWICDIFVIGLHLEDDKEKVDQVDPMQWQFLVIPTCDLEHGQDSMLLRKALERWQPVTWSQLSETVDYAISRNGK